MLNLKVKCRVYATVPDLPGEIYLALGNSLPVKLIAFYLPKVSELYTQLWTVALLLKEAHCFVSLCQADKG